MVTPCSREGEADDRDSSQLFILTPRRPCSCCEQSHETGAKYRNRTGALTLAMSRSATKLTSHKMEPSRDGICTTTKLERDEGFEPSQIVWKTIVLPLHQSRIFIYVRNRQFFRRY